MSKYLFALFVCGSGVVLFLLSQTGAVATKVSATQNPARYVGAVGCQASMCHGGASPSRCQFTIWSQQDFHSRAYATLTTPHSARIAEVLGTTPATENPRCTVCHAPLALVPKGELAATADVTEGVSCESCHNPAGAWLLGHTRPDWTYSDRLHAGMRDLRNVVVRADTCVKCHQVLDADILKAGHPELIFELDGQSASEPRHWTDKEPAFGMKAWLVGQLAALREITVKLASEQNPDPDLVAQQHALYWLLHYYFPLDPNEPFVDKYSYSSNLAPRIDAAIDVVLKVGPRALDDLLGSLKQMSKYSDDFLDSSVSNLEQALRAERLVMGLDRLSKSLPDAQSAKWQPELSALFDAVQDRDKFDPKDFAARLKRFADVVAAK